MEFEEVKRNFEQSEVDKKGLEKRVKDKDKKINTLESKIQDLEEGKIQQFSEY